MKLVPDGFRFESTEYITKQERPKAQTNLVEQKNTLTEQKTTHCPPKQTALQIGYSTVQLEQESSTPISSSPYHQGHFPPPSCCPLLSSLSKAPSHLTPPVQFEDNIRMQFCWFQILKGNLQIILKLVQKYRVSIAVSNTRKDCLTKDFLMALLVSSSASLYISWKNLFKAASPSSFSSFSWNQSTHIIFTPSNKVKRLMENQLDYNAHLLLHLGFKLVPIYPFWFGGWVRWPLGSNNCEQLHLISNNSTKT